MKFSTRLSFTTLLCLFLLRAYATPADISVSPGSVIGVVSADWNGDHNDDRAVLIETDDVNQVALLIYMSGKTVKRRLVIRVNNVAWQADVSGNKASISLNKRNSIIIRSGNMSVGRNRWRHTLTIVYRKGKFMIGGFTHNAYDTLDVKNTLDCDINYLAGKVVKNKKVLYIKNVAPPLNVWKADHTPSICRSR